MNKICPCNNIIIINKLSRVSRTKYCSKKCFYKYRIRAKGLKYKIQVKNKGWFLKDHIPWTKGRFWSEEHKIQQGIKMKGRHVSPKTEFKKGQFLNEKNINWRGKNVGYYALHTWIRRKFGNPQQCEFCGSTKNVQWANRTYLYKRTKSDWISLCFKCHRKYDSMNGWGLATKKFKLCLSQ